MTEAEFKAAQATMPWRTHTYQSAKNHVLVQMIDKSGHEVPLFTMLGVLEIVSVKLATKPKEAASETAPATN